MKKVLHLLSSKSFSGAENIAIKIIQNTAEEFDSIYVSPFGDISEKLEQNNIKYVPAKGIMDIIGIIREYDPDIIHAHDFKASVLAALFGNGRYVISHIHQSPNWSSKLNLKTFFYVIASKRINKIIYVSHDALNKYFFKNAIKNKVEVIYNSVNVKKIRSEFYKKTKKKYDLIFVGRMEQIKDPLFFVSIVNSLKNKNIKAVMLGDGKLTADVISKINDMNLSNNLFFKGFSSEPYKYINESKVCLIPSLNEGFSLVAIEAASLNVPIVARNTDGLSEVVNKLGGNLFNTKEQAETNINKLLNDSELYRKKSNIAYENVKKNFDDYNFTKKIKEVYKSIEK